MNEFVAGSGVKPPVDQSGDKVTALQRKTVSTVTHYRFVAPVVLVISVLLLTFLTAAQTRTAHKPRRTSANAPAAARAINAEEMQGLLKRNGTRPLLVNYWATWCDPCRDEFPDLVKIDKQYRPQGLDFIAITLDDLADLKTAVPKFLRLMNATMPVYLLNVVDPEPAINSVDREWGGALPATFLYNNKGEVVYKHFGRINTNELRAAIEKVMSHE
ncbi:MAG TPA: TlpA disulfide reductase family protein [Pyrinomonadaceae bacterium]|nr:TlpA disulfide reductase family protein [Pyrinomonadaceae bacterium]